MSSSKKGGSGLLPLHGRRVLNKFECNKSVRGQEFANGFRQLIIVHHSLLDFSLPPRLMLYMTLRTSRTIEYHETRRGGSIRTLLQHAKEVKVVLLLQP